MRINQIEFIKKVLPSIDKCSWFLGAGVSASANLPTAHDIIWDLKKRYYCLQENQDLKNHDIQIQQIKTKIQEYCNSKGFPEEYTDSEYSFYFDLIFGKDPEEQRRYVADVLDSKKITLSIGHRVLAALMSEKIAKVVYTTNFDKVIENAYAHICGANLSSYHLEGADACKAALNNDEFPLYAKVHGDFQYKRLANLEEHLLKADEQIRKCFLASSSRFGTVVAGYSGRDKCIMDLFDEALNVTNAFPHGLYWTTLKKGSVHPRVQNLIQSAQEKGISSNIVEVDNFDSLMTRLWRNLPKRKADLDSKVERTSERTISIPIPKQSDRDPLLRFNSLPIANLPDVCFTIQSKSTIDWQGLKEIQKLAKNRIICWIDEEICAWGSLSDIKAYFPDVSTVEPLDITSKIRNLKDHKSLHSALEELLCGSIANEEELIQRKNTLIISKEHFKSQRFAKLRNCVGQLGGTLPNLSLKNSAGQEELITPIWSQSLTIRIKQVNDNYLLLLTPDIWISPPRVRKKCISFLSDKRSQLKNDKMDQLITSWIETIFKEVGQANTISIKPFLTIGANGEMSFKTTTRTNYSRKAL